MDQLKQAALSFKKLLNQEYDFIIGRKGVKREFRITFVESDFHHLCGLHKLIDISQVQKKDRTKVFEEILSDDIKMETIQKSAFYSEMADRLEALPHLEKMLDSNDLIFRYCSRKNPWSRIEADFLLEGMILEKRTFLFVSGITEIKSCVSFFPFDKTDFSTNQERYTLLEKRKKDIGSKIITLLFDRNSNKKPDKANHQ